MNWPTWPIRSFGRLCLYLIGSYVFAVLLIVGIRYLIAGIMYLIILIHVMIWPTWPIRSFRMLCLYLTGSYVFVVLLIVGIRYLIAGIMYLITSSCSTCCHKKVEGEEDGGVEMEVGMEVFSLSLLSSSCS